ncbi:MAG: hypothetical protein COB66_07485 [Coxiella sp. (in: Bacteria)]|nr:MAG: hypothetical protein COB66_07485 [Coxiella sp. (in: g-proteobacteria)]
MREQQNTKGLGLFVNIRGVRDRLSLQLQKANLASKLNVAGIVTLSAAGLDLFTLWAMQNASQSPDAEPTANATSNGCST